MPSGSLEVITKIGEPWVNPQLLLLQNSFTQKLSEALKPLTTAHLKLTDDLLSWTPGSSMKVQEF